MNARKTKNCDTRNHGLRGKFPTRKLMPRKMKFTAVIGAILPDGKRPVTPAGSAAKSSSIPKFLWRRYSFRVVPAIKITTIARKLPRMSRSTEGFSLKKTASVPTRQRKQMAALTFMLIKPGITDLSDSISKAQPTRTASAMPTTIVELIRLGIGFVARAGISCWRSMRESCRSLADSATGHENRLDNSSIR